MKKYLILTTLAGFIIALDQASKIYIHTQFAHGESLPVILDYFSITYVRNTGAAFGFLREAPEHLRNVFFMIMPPLACVIIFFLLRSTPNKDNVSVLALSSIFGGALGNYIDRLRLGYVVDFIEFHYKTVWSYPAFNVADIAIVTGISVMILLEFTRMGLNNKSKVA